MDEDLQRTDLRLDPSDGTVQAGFPLSLNINVAQLQNCTAVPLSGAYVDIWHCNALGVYSDIGTAAGKKFLRGYQPTNRHGNAYFLTVYPGWYMGRAVHIHVKVRVFAGYSETYEFTSQFFFDDAFTDQIYRLPPYNNHGVRDTLNSNDGIYQGASSTSNVLSGSGSYLMLTLRQKDTWVEADAKLVCDLSLGSSPDQTGGGGMPGGGMPGGGMPGGGFPPGGTPPPGGIPPGGTPPTP